jgi:hypothetical protein
VEQTACITGLQAKEGGDCRNECEERNWLANFDIYVAGRAWPWVVFLGSIARAKMHWHSIRIFVGFRALGICCWCIDSELNMSVECIKCGHCCRSLILEISREEAERRGIADKCHLMLGGQVYSMNSRQAPRFECVFLKDNLCSIYDKRPYMCQMFQPGSEQCILSGWLYERSCDNKFRYVLGERGNNPLICIGVNPSTAEPNKLDPTLRNVKSWAQRLGYDGWVMLNLYPQRATNPKDLHADPDSPHFIANVIAVRNLRKKLGCPVVVWAAWGTLIEKRPYLSHALWSIRMALPDANWIHIGPLSAKGHPHHPLYLSHKSTVQEFDITEYLKKESKCLQDAES